jgi:AcrR family transcriptional regulator
MRRTSAEIDHAILDVAAGIFAVHGFAHTSVQQIADAVGYSKPGLLHRFGSKEALHRAVLAEVAQTVQQVTTHATSHHGRPDQVRQVLTLMTRKALDRPGVVQMMLRAFGTDRREPELHDLRAAGYRLVEAVDHPRDTPVDRLRLGLALRLIANAATLQHSAVHADMHVDSERLVPLLVRLAEDVLRDG